MSERGHRRVMGGMVVSDASEKTIIVNVIRRYKHPLFKKYVSKNKKYSAHDEKNLCGVGDEVLIEECRPMSKTKRYRLKKIIKKAE